MRRSRRERARVCGSCERAGEVDDDEDEVQPATCRNFSRRLACARCRSRVALVQLGERAGCTNEVRQLAPPRPPPLRLARSVPPLSRTQASHHHGPVQTPLARRQGQHQARILAPPAPSDSPHLGRRHLNLDLVHLAFHRRRARQADRGRPACAREVRHGHRRGRFRVDGAHVGDAARAGVGGRGAHRGPVRRGAPPFLCRLMVTLDLHDES